MTLRLADLPSEIPADPIYKQIQSTSEKLKELSSLKANLDIERSQFTSGTVDENELLFRIKRVINSLEKAPVEDRRPIYANLIKFAELHPTKIRMGVYAPTASAASEEKRVGSCTVMFGARVAEVEEPPWDTKSILFEFESVFKKYRATDVSPAYLA